MPPLDTRLLACTVAAWLLLSPTSSGQSATGSVLPPWSPGTLDIHQIATGRGNAAFIQFPDGRTLLVDAGDAAGDPTADPRPDGSRRAGEWIARYVAHMLEGRTQALDYALLTHFHPDHIGGIAGSEARSTHGDYLLTGITEVAERLPIRTLIDRGTEYLPSTADAMIKNYRAFVAAQTAAGRMTYETAHAGSDRQIAPRNASAEFPYDVRIVSANDLVWTGDGDHTSRRFPPLAEIADPADRPTENMCSVSLRIRYGRFDYFTGGDTSGYPVPGAPAWHDEETAIARAIGPTDVHVVNHHGSIEEENPVWLATLHSRVMVLPAWSATHPSADVLKRMLSQRLYVGARDVFVTEFRDPTKLSIGARAAQVASDHGHILVRVERGGSRYSVCVLDDTTESYRVRLIKGPYDAN